MSSLEVMESLNQSAWGVMERVGGARSILLLGRAGSGKSRLATMLAGRMLHPFKPRALYLAAGESAQVVERRMEEFRVFGFGADRFSVIAGLDPSQMIFYLATGKSEVVVVDDLSLYAQEIGTTAAKLFDLVWKVAKASNPNVRMIATAHTVRSGHDRRSPIVREADAVFQVDMGGAEVDILKLPEPVPTPVDPAESAE